MKFTKEEARRKVLNCAKQYQQQLLNKKLLIMYHDRQDKVIRYIEVVFLARNFQHLAGWELIDKDGNIIYNQSVNFSKIVGVTCLNGCDKNYQDNRGL